MAVTASDLPVAHNKLGYRAFAESVCRATRVKARQHPWQCGNAARAPYTIQRYYNSPLHGAAATTPPCGFNLIELGPDNFTIDMGFEIDDRFISATRFGSFAALGMFIAPDNHPLNIVWYDTYRQQFTGISYGIAVF
jgi:hypothetical protein